MKNVLLLVIGFFCALTANAQCSMCKATAEQSDYAAGINEGILYLMPLPAIIMSVFGVILYVNYKKKNAKN
jgi:hypothetical protein